MVVVLVSDSGDEDDGPPCSIPCVRRRRSHHVSARLGVSPREYRRMKRWAMPDDLFQLLGFLQFTLGWAAYSRQCIEFMGGIGAVAGAFTEDLLEAYVYDIAITLLNDFLDCRGFVECLTQARTLEPAGLQHWDTVCSSWVWMVRSVTHRTSLFPLGNLRNRFTAQGNLMVSRMVCKAASLNLKNSL